MILTENLSVLTVILNEFAEQKLQPEVVFGSKFREDVTYTQVKIITVKIQIFCLACHPRISHVTLVLTSNYAGLS